MARLACIQLAAAAVVIAGLVAAAATAAASRDPASRRNASSAPSIAALGASAETGFATAGAFAEAPANSWVTGTNPAVRSIYLRLRELNPAIAGTPTTTRSRERGSATLPTRRRACRGAPSSSRSKRV